MPGDIKSFMMKDTAGLPNWAWVLVVGAGIAAAYVIPKFLNKGSSSTNPPTTGTDTSGTSGLGLAIDPTTGLPYAVEGLVPSGSYAGNSQGNQPGPPPPLPGPPPGPQPLPQPQPQPGPPPTEHKPGDVFTGPTGVIHYVATGNQTLTDIARQFSFQSWNSLYAIPENQKMFGNPMDSQHAAAYKPPAGMAIVLPGGGNRQGGGPTYATIMNDPWSGVRQVRISANGTGY